MGIVTNIIDALRRIGHPTARSALRRQDETLRGVEVLERDRRIVRDPAGNAEVFRARIAKVQETVVDLSNEELEPILENASLVSRFISAFLGEEKASWTLPELDRGFEVWLSADEKRGYSDEAVVEILGAAFGQYCVGRLNMRWVRVTDKDGIALGIDGVEREFRGFPYHSISKRIADREHGFFVPLFITLKGHSEEASLRGSAEPNNGMQATREDARA